MPLIERDTADSAVTSSTSRLWAGALLFAVFFCLTAAIVLYGQTESIERRGLEVLRNTRNPARIIGPKPVGEWMMETTTLGGYTVLTMLFVFLWIFLRLRKDASRYFLLLSMTGGYGVHVLLKYVFARPRPDVVPHLVDAGMASFPSGHAFMSTVTYYALAVIFSRWTDDRRIHFLFFAAATLLMLLVGVSRVFVGVHYPTDVVAGWTSGGAWLALTMIVARRNGWLRTVGPAQAAGTSKN